MLFLLRWQLSCGPLGPRKRKEQSDAARSKAAREALRAEQKAAVKSLAAPSQSQSLLCTAALKRAMVTRCRMLN